MALHESAEMYLETIYVLSQRRTNVRSIDIAEHMSYSKPSVSRAVGILKNENYITVGKDGYITLTDKGLALAQKIYERHDILSKMLISVGVPETTAIEDACRLEHAISDESFAAFKAHFGDMKK